MDGREPIRGRGVRQAWVVAPFDTRASSFRYPARCSVANNLGPDEGQCGEDDEGPEEMHTSVIGAWTGRVRAGERGVVVTDAVVWCAPDSIPGLVSLLCATGRACNRSSSAALERELAATRGGEGESGETPVR